MEDRKRFFDALAAKYPPGSILQEDAQKAGDRHVNLAQRRSVVEARQEEMYGAQKVEDRNKDRPKRWTVADGRPGAIYDAQKAEDQPKNPANRRSVVETRPEAIYDAQKVEDRNKDRPKRWTVAEGRQERKHLFGGSQKRLSVLRALPATFGMSVLDENIADLAESPTEVEKRMRQSQPQQRSQSMVQARTGPTYEPDYNIMSESVFGLDESNFDDFIESKEKALIMFYKDFQCPMADFEANFADVAESSRNAKHGFGAVDCVMNRALCTREKICCTPELKLYSNGFEVGNIMKAQNATAAQMSMMVAMTPVLKQPKITTKPSYQTCQTNKRASVMW